MSQHGSSSSQTSLFQARTEPRELNGHKIVIIDGHALAFRSYYAIRELTNSKGQSTNAVYGFVRSLLKILKEEGEFDATVVTFDADAKTFRHEQYEDYKAGRAPIPEDLPGQIDTIKQLVELLGLYSLEVPGLEADDLIGTIATRCAERGYAVEIVTSDRDAYQLVSERICVRGLDKSERYGPDEVFDKYGVRVDQWVDYRALTGDSSDNIPGAKGIGPVTAQKLLARYGTLEQMFAKLDQIEPQGVAKKLRDSLEEVRFSRELSRIITDADIDCDPETWANRELNKGELRRVLETLEFGSILRELGLSGSATYQESPWPPSADAGALGYVLSEESPMRATLTDLAVAQGDRLARTQDEGAMRDYLRDLKQITACNAKALSVYARRQGLSCQPADDPLLMAYVLDPNTATAEAAARRYGAGEWRDNAAARAVVTSELGKTLDRQLTGQQRTLYETLERPLAAVLAEMEYRGVRIDRELLVAQSAQLAAQLTQLEEEVREVAANPALNLNSRDQLAELLFDKLELTPGKRTSTGKRSTAVSALEPLREAHPVVSKILEYRELSKLKSTYLDPLPKLIHPDTGRVHTTFNQTVVATGRLSSTNPNLQNIPVRSDLGRQIRRGFIADEGMKLLVADYSQIELRILAHIAQEDALIEAFNEAQDIHRRTAAEVHNVAMNEVTPEMRRVAKVINFGVLYGMSAHRLTRELGIGFDEAEAFIDTYFARYPKVRQYIDETLEFARQHKYVETLLGRRRMIPEIDNKNRNLREYAERTAYNMPIQGSAADIMKLAMVKLAPALENHRAAMVLQVHDELIVEVAEDEAGAVGKLIQTTMENAYTLNVPLIAEVGAGNNWLDAK